MREFPFLNSFVDRHGRRRWYFRRFGKRAALPAHPSESAEAEAAYADALRASTSLREAKGPPHKSGLTAGPRSLAALIRSYRSTPEFLSCRPSTQRAYNIDLREIEALWGVYPAPGLTRAKVNELMANRAGEPKRANRLHKRLRAIMEHAIDIGWIEVNPVGRRRPFKVAVDGYPTWPDDQIALFHKHWPRGAKQRVAFDLLLYLGQRTIDTVVMARNHIAKEDGRARIRVTQEKTGASGYIALHADLRATLDEGPLGGLYLIETAEGAPRTVKGFYNWLKAAAADAGCDPKLSPHGLRKAAATRLIDAGCSAAEAAAITMHRSLAELERYIKARDQKRLADAAIERLERTEQKRALTNSKSPVGNPVDFIEEKTGVAGPRVLSSSIVSDD